MMTLFRVLRSIRRRPKYVVGFLVAGVLGLSGNLYLDSLEGSIRKSLAGKSRELLTADLSISVRRIVTGEDRKKIDDFLRPIATEKTRSLDLFSMLSARTGSRLVQLVAIEENYPLVGFLTLEKAGRVDRTASKASLGHGKVWIDPDVRDTFGLTSGDSVKIGSRDFQVTDVVLDDTSNTWRSFSIAPRVVLSVEDLWTTGLVRKGSTVWDRTYSVLRPEIDPAETARGWNASSEDRAIRATPAAEASEQIAKLTSRLNDYLGLVGVTTLFLAMVGIAFLFQTELRRRVRMIGTLRALGDATRRIVFEISLEALVLGAAAGILSMIVVHFTLPLAARFVADLSGVQIFPIVSIRSAVTTVGLGALLGFFMAYPFANQIGRFKPSALFQDEANFEMRTGLRDLPLFLPLIALFFGLSIFCAHSWKVGSIFFALSFLSVLALYGVGRVLLSRLARLHPRRLTLRLALRSLARNPGSSLSGFVAVGIGTLLLSLIPDLRSIMESEIESPEGTIVPSLFLFDIQEEQRAGVEDAIRSLGGSLAFQSPLVRARLETLRGKPVEKALDFSERSTREQEEEERSRNRGFNLTYREKLSDSETLVSGRNFESPFVPDSGKLPEVTLERQFADRLGVRLGDQIGFDVQGVPIEASVVGLRRVRWSSFQPNFFVVFQPGVLDDAPKTFLGGIPKLDSERKRKIQSTLVERFPNVSVLQVDEVIRKILLVFNQMSVAILVTALLSLVTGGFVVYSIAQRQVLLRRKSALLMRAVGASGRDLCAVFLWEFGLLAGAAALLGLTFSFVVSRGIAWFLFDRLETHFPLHSFSIGVAVTVLVLFEAFFASISILKEKPWRLLQAEGER